MDNQTRIRKNIRALRKALITQQATFIPESSISKIVFPVLITESTRMTFFVSGLTNFSLLGSYIWNLHPIVKYIPSAKKIPPLMIAIIVVSPGTSSVIWLPIAIPSLIWAFASSGPDIPELDFVIASRNKSGRENRRYIDQSF